MSEQPQGGSTGRWLKRITQSMSGEPRDLAELIEDLREASERGLFDGDALVMLEGVLAVADMQVRDIMVPRSQMVFVERDEPPDKLVELVVESGHSRFPVIGEDRDQILGILLAKDLLRLQAAGDESFEIREYMRPVVFVPESKRLNVLLKEFRRSHNHIAMVVDEYGGVCGLVQSQPALSRRATAPPVEPMTHIQSSPERRNTARRRPDRLFQSLSSLRSGVTPGRRLPSTGVYFRLWRRAVLYPRGAKARRRRRPPCRARPLRPPEAARL